MKNKSATKIKKDKNFISCFNQETGFYFRTGILEDGKDTGVDPFMASFPELLDVGIMGHCIHGKTGLCQKAGIGCYQDGLHSNNPNMSLEDFKKIAEQCKGKTFQFALGGCGDPDQHEHFEEILKVCKENGIVPNFTTSGFGMTKALAKLCKQYCGAVAVSWYRSPYTLNPLILDSPCCVDPDALVAWDGADPQFKLDVSFKNLLGKMGASGESYQMEWSQPGTQVIVQPSERKSGIKLAID